MFAEVLIYAVFVIFVVVLEWSIDWFMGTNEAIEPKKVHGGKDYYEGEMKEGKPHGVGKLYLCNCSIYEGEFENGKMKGQGKLKWENGDEYNGMVNAGKLDGRGTYTYANGDVYEGDLVNGESEGNGKT